MRRGLPTGTVTSLLLKPQKQCLIDVALFWLPKLLYSRSILFKHTNNFGSVFPGLLDHGIYEAKLPTHVSFVFPHFLFL